MSDQTHLLARIMGLQDELNHFGENSWQRQIRHEAGLSVISYLEQRLKFHLKSLLEHPACAGTIHRLSNAA